MLQLYSKCVDMLVFSYDRPMQLDVFLGSLKKYCSGLDSCYVLYRSTSSAFDCGFDKVRARYPEVKFVKQGKNPSEDFKPLVLDIIFKKTLNEYIVFGIDDMVAKDFCDFEHCIKLLEKHNAYAFYLRLGLHIAECYSARKPQKLPSFANIEDEACKWCFKNGNYEFGYPNDLSMALYKKSTIKSDLYHLSYSTPNSLEGGWARLANLNEYGLFFRKSKMINLPINKVQKDNANHHMNLHSAHDLLKRYMDGYIIDTRPLHQIRNIGACIEWHPTFIKKG